MKIPPPEQVLSNEKIEGLEEIIPILRFGAQEKRLDGQIFICDLATFLLCTPTFVHLAASFAPALRGPGIHEGFLNW